MEFIVYVQIIRNQILPFPSLDKYDIAFSEPNQIWSLQCPYTYT